MSQHPPRLDYAAPADSPREILWEERAGAARVVIPARPMWVSTAMLTLKFLFCASISGALLYFNLRSIVVGRGVGYLGFPLLLVFLPFAFLTARALWLLPKTGRIPTVITAGDDGLLITTAFHGPFHQYNFHRADLRGLSVKERHVSFSTTRITVLAVAVVSGNSVRRTELEIARNAPAAQIEAFLRRTLGNIPSA